jgi:hypothetical protein
MAFDRGHRERRLIFRTSDGQHRTGVARRTRCCPDTGQPRTPGGLRWGIRPCRCRSCDARSHVTSELMDRRSDGVGRVAPGECSMPVPRPGVRRRSCLLGCEARGRAQGPLIHPGDHQARGKAGRVNASKPLMTPRNGQLRRWDEDRGDRAWPLKVGASGDRRDWTGRVSTAGPRGKEGTQSGRDSDVRNVEIPSGPGAGCLVGRP